MMSVMMKITKIKHNDTNNNTNTATAKNSVY